MEIRITRRLLASLVTVCLTAAVSRALDPSQPPGGNFDLSHWKLTLPVDSSGGTNGTATEIPTAQLVAGYTNAAYFYTGADGAMVFWCPVTGATTSGSDYPRTELRELLNPSDSSVNWVGYGTHLMDAQCQMIQVPSTKKVIIGQIHGYTGAARPLLKLQYNNGTIDALVKESPNSDTDTHFPFPSNVGLSNNITYQIKMADGLLSMVVNGSTQSVNVFQTDPAWTNQTLYFKAGNYCQDNSGPSTEGALVSFYALTVNHYTNAFPAILTQPASQTVAGGSNVTLSVVAAGAAPLAYQWRINAVNSPGGTNTSLTIANFQSADEANYDVVVANAAGSVTSAMARLYLNEPTRFTGCGVDASNYFTGLLLGAANSSYVIQASTNLTDWVGLTTNSSPSGVINFIDTNAPGFIQRFYRAR
ncbi:MAG TPA: polysaccharide lyase family 7 protein [Verrucomicrobiae bacterium]|nr:polysaccharide lyase family 7 protein [Verrucomicrobiae bacterium]